MSDVTPPTMTTPLDWFRWVDTLSGYTYLNGFLFVILILIYYFTDGTNSDKFLTSTLITALAATLLRAVNLTSDLFLGIFWGLTALAILLSSWSK